MPSPSATFRSGVHRALRHYERAIAALHGEDYRGIPHALRADLLERLGRERNALLHKMAQEGLRTKRNAPAADASPHAPALSETLPGLDLSSPGRCTD